MTKTTPLIDKKDIELIVISKKADSENKINNSSWGCEINISDCVTDGVECLGQCIGQMLIECCIGICKF